MKATFGAIAVLGVFALPASAQQAQPDLSTLAQALDRCIASYAVRLTKTDMADEAIYKSAVEGCKPIELDLKTAVRRDIAAPQAEAAIQQWDAQARPNFMSLLQRIRTDRVARGGQ
jgi:hypothetical protein